MTKKQKKTFIIVLVSICIVAVLINAFGLIPGKESEGVDITEESEELEKVKPVGPAFNTDSCYAFLKAQCDFGPRPMNTSAHDKCEAWIVAQFKRLGCKVLTQKADLKGYDGTVLHSTNIMAQYRPEATKRIMFCAHWDSRPWADNDPDSANHRKPIIAANDAASGVAVMLELARLLQDPKAREQMKNHDLGVDFVCFDAEDWGTPQWSDQPDDGNSWALGAQHFSENLPQGYAPSYGILLDMVGGQGAKFYQEGTSKQYAPDIVKKVWRAARQAGYGSFFPKSDGGMITDDHLPVNQRANIPCIDVIPYYPDCQQSSFGPTWHTLDDDLEHIDRNTLKAVGQTMVQVIWTEE
jgi:glutaminyl-peptide cyclotransferase